MNRSHPNTSAWLRTVHVFELSGVHSIVRGLLDLNWSYLHWTCNFESGWGLDRAGRTLASIYLCSEVKPPFLLRLSELELSCANLMQQRLGEDVFCMQRYRGNAKNLIQALHFVFSSSSFHLKGYMIARGCYEANASWPTQVRNMNSLEIYWIFVII